MAVRYFPKNTNADTNCDAGSAADLDLSETQDTSTGQNIGSGGNVGYVEMAAYDIALAARDGTSYDFSIDITAISQTNVRWRIEEIAAPAGCGTVQSSAYTTQEPASVGIATGTVSLAAWTTGTRLRLSIETQQTSTCGLRRITINVNDADTFVDAPDPVASGRRIFIVT